MKQLLIAILEQIQEISIHAHYAHTMAWELHSALLETTPGFDAAYRKAHKTVALDIRKLHDESHQQINVALQLLRQSDQ